MSWVERHLPTFARWASGASHAIEVRGTRDPRRGAVITQLPLYLQMQRIGGNVTPAQVSEIIRQADLGRMYQLMDLANESRQRDCHLQSVLQTRELAVAGLEWQVVPRIAKGAKKARLRDTKAAEFVQEKLREAKEFPTLLAHLIGAKYYGYSVAEIFWKKDGEHVVPSHFEAVPQRRFIFDIKTGDLNWCDLSGGMTYPGVNLQREYPGRFIQFQPRVNGDVPCREGLVRVLMWVALFRNWDLRDWMTLAELAWKPWRTGSYEKNAQDEDIDNLTTVLEGMTANGVAVYPNTTEVKIEWPKAAPKGGSTHKELFDAMGAEMSKAVVGQTLTTEQGARGSQALGRIHNEVRRDLLEADARDVAAIIERDIIEPMVRMNFGEDVKVPKLEFITDDSADVAALATAMEKLCGPNVRLRVSQAHVRDVAGIPEPEEGEELCGPDPNDDEDDAEDDPKPGEDPPLDDKPAEEPVEEKPKKAA